MAMTLGQGVAFLLHHGSLTCSLHAQRGLIYSEQLSGFPLPGAHGETGTAGGGRRKVLEAVWGRGCRLWTWVVGTKPVYTLAD